MVVACVGSDEYLLDQMKNLDLLSGEIGIFPTVLNSGKRRHFGMPRKALFEVYSLLLIIYRIIHRKKSNTEREHVYAHKRGPKLFDHSLDLTLRSIAECSFTFKHVI